jgi:cytochrome c oxidase subunit IV
VSPMHGPRRYVFVWIALLALTVTTYAVSRVDLGGHWNLTVALAIAAAKAALVALFFMHLWDGKGTNRIVFVVSLFFLLLLMGGVVGDMATRFPLARPPEASGLEGPEPKGPGRDTVHGAQNQRVR